MKNLSILLSLITLISITACGGGGDDSSSNACEIIGLPTRIINGSTCGSLETASVVRIMTTTASATIPSCSGTLITPNVVLSAAHCFEGGSGVTGYGIYIGEPGRGTFVPAIDLSIAPGYRYDSSTERLFNDAALMLLQSPVSLPVIPILLTRSPQVGEDGYVYGYGIRNVEGTADDFFTLEAGTMEIENVTPNHLFVTFKSGGVNVCNGDSGGPLVVTVNGDPAVAGVVSMGSNNDCAPGDVTTFTNLQSPTILSWLADNVPNAYIRSDEVN